MGVQAGEYEATVIGGVRNIIVDYVDGEGVASTREIVPFKLRGTINTAQKFKILYIEARCLTAKANRTFRVDRLRSIADARTGEMLSLDDWLKAVQIKDPVAITLDRAVEAPVTPQVEYVQVRRGPRWRWLIILLMIGYVIGRYRLIRWALRAAGQHWGLWL
ncbi:WYL domain-containing protein [Sphingomonas sp. CCH10-B3]|uniref:WYL domain-containing protein n=1 Tax=Sphingomonas sp. CCH10-B3 TaxID=1768757 RepID=UPI000834D617|nr:hypothetical protein [Sphingomonas sp. CCH10-B3]